MNGGFDCLNLMILVKENILDHEIYGITKIVYDDGININYILYNYYKLL